MQWLREIGPYFQWLVGACTIAYAAYLIRVLLIARKLNATTKGLYIKFLLRICYIGLIMVAIIGPLYGVVEQQATVSGKDIWVMLDISASMEATDVPPNRLDRAKQFLSDLAALAPNNRIGLIGFSTEAFVHCPLTNDKEALQLFLQTLSPQMMPQQGSDLVAPLTVLAEVLEQDTSKGLNTAQCALLITDGETDADLNPIAKRLVAQNVPLLVLGVGTEAGASLPRKREVGKDAPISSLNPILLSSLASACKGNYYHLDGVTNPLQAVNERIAQVQGKLFMAQTVQLGANKYHFALVMALVLMIIDVVFTIGVIKW
ncbi:MAG: vWA domain-containing protein [Flexibacteraceae bacterium]